ncbi:uncharacterized protein YqjF (DUF2071 family) [Peribacillus deserti]|uniref:Uncharacterized protein YqjF (DUF2071 family) n=1 Tax=Peribacillus deserti TaxID=673318 RepID=A0ABS2QNZ1_9BACI|nr:DUF2071 domain-containing protein [Peribacillus deserti]MBM7694645.1 uncharacterized protein YqjF (DUF2071 family) [Peribacillus deserti]
MYKEFKQIDHRPYPLPPSTWLMKQEWNDLLFLHWPVPVEILREKVPKRLDLDLFEGTAWITITPFKVTGMRFHGLPPIPFMNAYLELNVRTYVRFNGIPGIYFFSLDANHLPSVLGAKTFFALPYKLARMSYKKKNGVITFTANRTPAGEKEEIFKASYEPEGELFSAVPGTLDYWLMERYCLFTYRGSQFYRGDIHHDQWKMTLAKTDIEANTMPSILPDSCYNGKPFIHYSPFRRVFFFPLKKVE